MSPATNEPREEAVLVLAPTGRDAALAAGVLAEHGIRTVACSDIGSLCRELDVGAGAVLLAEEALGQPAARCLEGALREQPPWSELPLVVFSSGDPSIGAIRRTLAAIAPLGNVTLLDRPVRMVALVSALQSALRARRRQCEVRDLLARLERSVHDRDRFLAMLGHELRNPLSVIVFGIQLLSRTAGMDEGARRRCAMMERQSSLLARLVDDLLDVARVTSGRMRLINAPVELAALVWRSVDAAGPSIQAQGLELEVAVGSEPLVVTGDVLRLEQIVSNLLSNATKYTPSGGRIRVAVTRAGGRAVIAVEDTGVGIAIEMLSHIFEPFTQVESSLDRARGGMGLGLSVVRSLVVLHGGTVEAASPGLGLGSRFTVTLPLSPEAPAQGAPRPGGREAPAVAARRVVVIEDNADLRESLQTLIELSGHHVRCAADGLSGVATVLAEEPDVVFVDIGLPGLDGYQVARHIRAALGDRVLLAALTGYGQPEDEQRSREAGFDVHLTKPVELGAVERLLAAVARQGP
ncbi:hypothetical protein BE17_07720 [Sorangium cellulosum]|uniref:histidine kinase n=1 Tax=Sorangium cellulosum TaxID=56 RepID=A0A150RZ05_SORCE|nr:hypothetical protein BE17_07720 [Sorangium cellulosum]